ncbi:MAG: hypothetical protein WD824_06415 [Cyclobacteriaceae bacterium]
MIDNSIKVGFCVAYDWHFLAYSLPLIYNEANIICLSVDKDHISWAKQSFIWDESEFYELIRSIDKSRKIIVYTDNFHFAELTPAKNEIRQRTLMAEKMGKGGWHIQLDCDEYFLDFDRFVEYLKKLPAQRYKFNLSCQLITVFKKVDDGYLFVYPAKRKDFEFLQIATRDPLYEHGRRNGYFNILADFLIVHQSWARGEAEILQKLSNWGHINDFDIDPYFQFWQGVNVNNFKKIKNFHPIQPSSWSALKFIEAKSVNELIVKFRQAPFPGLDPLTRFLKNSILASGLMSRISALYKMIFYKDVSK